jgi:tetratricopeptide (TPR) repeat protein
VDDAVVSFARWMAGIGRFLWDAISWRFVFQAGIIVVLGVWIYYPSLHGLYLWDDDFLIQNNEVVHNPSGLYYIWTDPEHALIDFFPLTVSFEWLLWQVFYTPDRADPMFLNMTVYFHVTSLILHLVNAMLVWFLFRRLGIRLAWLGALLFTVHPVLVESVSWMAELKNTIAMPSFILAVLAWISYERARRWEYYVAYYVFAFGLYVISMLTKTSCVMFPVIILLYSWWKHPETSFWRRFLSEAWLCLRLIGALWKICFWWAFKSPTESFRRFFKDAWVFGWTFVPTIPFFVIAISDAYFLIIYLRHGVGEQFIPGLLGGPLGRTACAGLSLIFYFSKCVLPYDLLPIYPQWVVNPPDLGNPWMWLAFVAAYAGLWWFRKQLWARITGYVLTFFLLIVLPFFDWLGEFWPWPFMALGFWWLLCRRDQPWARTAVFGFGFFFLNLLPFVGWRAISFMRFGWVMDHFLYVPILGLLGLAAAAASDLYGRIPSNAPAWRIAAISTAVAILTVFTIGSHLYAEDFVNRLTYWTYCADRNYMAWPAHNNRGNQLLDNADRAARAGFQYDAQAMYAESKKEFLIALQLNPVYTEAHNNLGYILSREGHLKAAEMEFRTALKYTPDFESAQLNLARVLQLEKLQSDYQQAVEFAKQGRYKEAEAAFRQTLQFAPDFQPAQNGLAQVLQLEAGQVKTPAK